jgi:hypothetical protein
VKDSLYASVFFADTADNGPLKRERDVVQPTQQSPKAEMALGFFVTYNVAVAIFSSPIPIWESDCIVLAVERNSTRRRRFR